MVHTILSKEQNGIFTVRVLFLGTPITMTHTKHEKYISRGFQIAISLLPQVIGHVEHWCDHLRLPLRNFPFQWGRGYQRADPKRLLHVSSSSFFAQESNSRDDTRTKLHGCKISDITELQVPTEPLEGDLHTGNRADHKPSAGEQIDKPLQAQNKANFNFFAQSCPALFSCNIWVLGSKVEKMIDWLFLLLNSVLPGENEAALLCGAIADPPMAAGHNYCLYQ